MSDSTGAADLLTDAFSRIQQLTTSVVTGLSSEQLAYQPKPGANSIGWLVWHLIRIQDDHVADAAGTEQVWTAQGWHDRLGLPFDAADTGYGHGPEQVAAVVIADPELLIGYADAVCQRTAEFVGGLSATQLSRVVDERWDPPVTLGVRLVSVLGDDWQHLGQAGYLKGLLPG
ncbi:MAG TPA: DinB family protein [Jatrophihabitans sp.]|nr:DinB family protein [Jatrophihabitans sp.]